MLLVLHVHMHHLGEAVVDVLQIARVALEGKVEECLVEAKHLLWLIGYDEG